MGHRQHRTTNDGICCYIGEQICVSILRSYSDSSSKGRYVLTPDTEFGLAGRVSNIEYLETYGTYLETARDVLLTASGRETKDLWDSYVLGGRRAVRAEPNGEDHTDLNLLRSQIRARARVEARVEGARGSSEEACDSFVFLSSVHSFYLSIL